MGVVKNSESHKEGIGIVIAAVGRHFEQTDHHLNFLTKSLSGKFKNLKDGLVAGTVSIEFYMDCIRPMRSFLSKYKGRIEHLLDVKQIEAELDKYFPENY